MALINCPECKHKISDRSVSCTNCGLPTSKMRFSIQCPECYESISNQSASCNNCGLPIAKLAPFKNTQPSPEELKEMQLLKELEEAGEPDEYGFFNNTNMFIIACVIIYFISKDEIHYIFQHVIGLFSN